MPSPTDTARPMRTCSRAISGRDAASLRSGLSKGEDAFAREAIRGSPWKVAARPPIHSHCIRRLIAQPYRTAHLQNKVLLFPKNVSNLAHQREGCHSAFTQVFPEMVASLLTYPQAAEESVNSIRHPGRCPRAARNSGFSACRRAAPPYTTAAISNNAFIPAIKERFCVKPPATAPSIFAPKALLLPEKRRKLSVKITPAKKKGTQ